MLDISDAIFYFFRYCGRSERVFMKQLNSNDVWAMCQTYGVESARASITSEITNVFGAYGIQVPWTDQFLMRT